VITWVVFHETSQGRRHLGSWIKVPLFREIGRVAAPDRASARRLADLQFAARPLLLRSAISVAEDSTFWDRHRYTLEDP
jgi:hypothetical protein